MKLTLKVKGMHCKSCETLINDALLEAGAGACHIDSKKGTAVVEFDETKLTSAKIRAIIEKEGYKVD